MWTSVPQMPVRNTRMRTSLMPISGRGTSSSQRPGSACLLTSAFMPTSPTAGDESAPGERGTVKWYRTVPSAEGERETGFFRCSAGDVASNLGGFMNRGDAFYEAILDNPDDDAVRLVYADWLQEQGDPRSEFIRVQCDLAKLPPDDPRATPLKFREWQLLEKHGRTWGQSNRDRRI